MGALTGYKLLDFSTLLPGPYATLTLADLGAEVLHVSSRDRPDLVTVWPPVIPGTAVTGSHAWLGRNKKTMCLDLKKPAAVAAVKALVADYDIVVEQFRPGVMDRLGLGYEALRAVNPRLIYCAVSGYGQTGPLAAEAGHDINYLARSGLIASSGRAAEGPALSGYLTADLMGAMSAVTAILAAILYRERTGQGQFLDIALQDAVIPMTAMDGASYLAGGPLPGRESAPLNGGGVYDYYETADGHYMAVGSLEPKFFAALCDAMGYPQWRDGAILSTDLPLVKATFRADFKAHTRAHWEEVFRTADACVNTVVALDEAVANPHFQLREMWPTVPVPCTDGVSVVQPGSPLKLSACMPEYRHAAYPTGYHTREVLSALGYDGAELDALL